ncbi:unnamed protein product [Closterium sp. NIES-53]
MPLHVLIAPFSNPLPHPSNLPLYLFHFPSLLYNRSSFPHSPVLLVFVPHAPCAPHGRVQGRENAITFLNENPHVCDELEQLVREHVAPVEEEVVSDEEIDLDPPPFSDDDAYHGADRDMQ